MKNTTLSLVCFALLLSISSRSMACSFLCDSLPKPEDVMLYSDAKSSIALPNQSLRLLVWNIYKQRKSDFWPEFSRLSSDKQLVLIQENALDEDFVNQIGNRYSMTHASNFFMKKNVRTGVTNLSLANATQVDAYITEDLEPFVKAPKAIVASKYPITGTTLMLLVINIHGINMSGDDALSTQLKAVDIIKDHQGPIIFAGDFNTKNKERHALTEKYMADYGLQKVDIKMSKKKVLDLVFVRGLKVNSAIEVNSKGSDHPALVLDLNLHTSRH